MDFDNFATHKPVEMAERPSVYELKSLLSLNNRSEKN